MSVQKEVIHTRIWQEIPETDNPFVAKECYCCGYDVFGEVVGKASWIEYLYLLFMQERPTSEHVVMLENLAVAIANPGPRDHSVRAAMNAGAGGSTYASSLMAALAVGAGQFGGAHEIAICMKLWSSCGRELAKWKNHLTDYAALEDSEAWGPMEHAPGFYPYSSSASKPVLQTLSILSQCSTARSVFWLQDNRIELEEITNCGLSFPGVAAAVFTDIGMTPLQGEMLYLLLRLPGAAVHALEQEQYGWRNYPFFSDALTVTDDPGPRNNK